MEKSADAFRTISEVADDLDLPQHVLRFWETRFGQIRPMKRGGGRRYYRPDDADLLRGIKHLLYGEGYTIKGVQRILKEEGVRFVQAVGREGTLTPASVSSAPLPPPDEDDEAVVDSPSSPTVATASGHAATERRSAGPAPSLSVQRSEPVFAPVPARDQDNGSADEAAEMLRARPRGAPLPLFEGLPGTLPPVARDALKRALAELEQCRRILADADPAEEDRTLDGAA